MGLKDVFPSSKGLSCILEGKVELLEYAQGSFTITSPYWNRGYSLAYPIGGYASLIQLEIVTFCATRTLTLLHPLLISALG